MHERLVVMKIPKVKIVGAGSIGNHLAHAARTLGWSVDICDIDSLALERTRLQIYPSRYGAWDKEIRLFHSHDAPKNQYDMIFIGTPPNTHISLAMEALKERPRAVLIEKPICGPMLEGASELFSISKELQVSVFVGYDHVLGAASKLISELSVNTKLGKIESLDVEFREHWAGIFNAHPWLTGPSDSYLGYTDKGGGALGEHSHAINLWQHFAHEIGAGKIKRVQAFLDFVDDGTVRYDKLAQLNLYSENGLAGRCIQDVITKPSRKWARLQFKEGYLEWVCAAEPNVDAVKAMLPFKIQADYRISKTRPDDFIAELLHIWDSLNLNNASASPISLERGLDTMLVIAAAKLSSSINRSIDIDYSKGYKLDALSAVE